MKRIIRRTLVALLVLIFGTVAGAQTTAFTNQGNLSAGGGPANGNYDFQFSLFSVASDPSVARLAALESILRLQDAEIEKQRKELEELKRAVYALSGATETCAANSGAPLTPKGGKKEK